MKILFIDESERQKNKNDKDFFCLTGLMVDEDKIIEIEESLRSLRQKSNIGNFKETRGKKDTSEKFECTKEIYNILNKNSVSILSAILGPSTVKVNKKRQDNYLGAIYFLIERFFLNLKKQGTKGIVVHDTIDNDTEEFLRKNFYEHIIHEELNMHGESKGKFSTLIYPSIFFSKDNHSEILQVCDLVSTSINHAFWKATNSEVKYNLEKLNEYNDFLKIYWPLFIKSPFGNIGGWGIKVWW